MRKWTEELNKRIYEHDTAAEQGFDRPEVTLQVQNAVTNQDQATNFCEPKPVSYQHIHYTEPSVLQTEHKILERPKLAIFRLNNLIRTGYMLALSMKLPCFIFLPKVIHDAEDDLVKAQLELEKVRDRLQQARLDLREKIAESASKRNCVQRSMYPDQ